MGRSIVKRGPSECSVPECDLETSPLRRPGPKLGCASYKSITTSSSFRSMSLHIGKRR